MIIKKQMMEAPWYTYQKKLKALFGRDPDIKISEVRNGKGADFEFDIEVLSHAKFVALNRVLKKHVTFGSVTLAITLYDEENSETADNKAKLFATLFEGNPILEDVRGITDDTGSKHTYVRFAPEVIQFFDDNLADYNGNWSGLAMDIAQEVFQTGTDAVNFCTAAITDGKEYDA